MRRLLLVLLPGAAALLAGCGGAPPFVTDRDRTLHIELSEYELDPENVRVREGRIHIVARNSGRLTHNIAVQAFKREIGEAATEYGRTDTAHPGETVSTDVTLGPGKYRLLCTIGNHDDLGQYGELQVMKE